VKKAFAAWSGGKDCCQAAYKASREGYEICYLLNMTNREVARSCSHGISARWISLQAAAVGIPMVQPKTSGDDYEAVFVAALKELRTKGIAYGIFGDIDFEPHREWNEHVCRQADIMPVLPLWQNEQSKVARDFIDEGFETVIITTQADLMGPEWLGRKFDRDFLQDIAAHNQNITPCGEAGEFHSLVIDGPLFRQRLESGRQRKSSGRITGFWILKNASYRANLIDIIQIPH